MTDVANFLPQMPPPYVEDRTPPTATEAQGLEFSIVSRMLRDPIAMLGYAPGVYQHGVRPPGGSMGEYWAPTVQNPTDRLYVDPRLAGAPEFPSVGAHEFRHRGLRELATAQHPGDPAMPTVPLPEVLDFLNANPEFARMANRIFGHPDSEEHFVRQADGAQGAPFASTSMGADSYAGRMLRAGIGDRRVPFDALPLMQSGAEQIVRALSRRLDGQQPGRWGDW